MVRKKYITIVGASIIVLAIAGVAAWQLQPNNPKTNNTATINLAKSTKSKSNAVTTITSNSSATQGNTTQQPTTTSNSSTSNSSSTTNSNSEAEQMLNPSTFTQYSASKYLNGTSAFFANLLTGTGAEVTTGHEVAVYYKGWLTNGTLFDQSKAGSNGQLQPLVFTYGATPAQVIPGFEEGITGMKVGGVRLVIIPPSVGYGSAGQGSTIPPNSVLVFQIQLAGVK